MKRQTMAITIITEAILLSMLLYSIFQWRTYWISTLVLSQVLMLVPLALEARKVILLPWPVVLGAALSLLLHGLGLVTEWYYTVFWWDKLTHMTSGVVLSTLVAIEVLLLDLRTESIKIPSIWYLMIIPIAILTLEGIWEILEYIIDVVLGTGMQHGLTDTVNDIVSNLISGIVGGIGVFLYLRRRSVDEFVSSLEAERLERWFVRGVGRGSRL